MLPWRDDSRFSDLSLAQASSSSGRGEEADGGGSSSSRVGQHIQSQLSKATSWHEAIHAVGDTLVTKVAEMFSLPLQHVDRGARLAKYGVDSLVAVELSNWFSHMLQGQLSIFEIMQSVSLGRRRELRGRVGWLGRG